MYVLSRMKTGLSGALLGASWQAVCSTISEHLNVTTRLQRAEKRMRGTADMLIDLKVEGVLFSISLVSFCELLDIFL